MTAGTNFFGQPLHSYEYKLEGELTVSPMPAPEPTPTLQTLTNQAASAFPPTSTYPGYAASTSTYPNNYMPTTSDTTYPGYSTTYGANSNPSPQVQQGDKNAF